MDASAKAEQVGRKADNSTVLDHAIRVGLIAYGVVHLLIAWLAVRIAFGDQESASSQGALSELATTGPGRISLYVVAVGFAALVVWQVIEAIFGARDKEGAKAVYKRVTAGGKAAVYAVLGFSALKVATGSSGGGEGTDTMTAKLMSLPGGQLLVALVGAVILGVAGAHVYNGFSERFMKKLEGEGHTGTSGRAFVLLGKAGYISKGIAFVIVGVLFIWAAVSQDPDKSGGLDQALHKVLEQPFGSPMLVLIALGFACYGLFCFAWARHLNR